jgi:hypothetical protein
METLEFIKSIDWSLLRQQKSTLLETIEAEKGGFKEMLGNLEGIVNLIDHLQDYAVDVMGVNENLVFDMEVEEKRELETPEELFAREMAEAIYDITVEGEGIYFDLPDGMTREFVDKVLDDQYNLDIIKGDMREAILNDVLERPNSFNKDEEGRYYYHNTMCEDYGGIIDKFLIEQYYKGKTKELYICTHCFSDNVELKMWVNANTKELTTEVETDGDDDCWCNDCQQHGILNKIEIPYLKEVIGFQVIDKNKNDNVHPRLISNKHICRLSQANEMIEDRDKDGNTKWMLKTIWSGIIENPEPIFGNDNPRD